MPYFSLWLAYVRYLVVSIFYHSRSPNVVLDSEMLGREVFFRSHIRESANRVKPGLFLPKESERRPFSVNRLTLANRLIFVALGKVQARARRSNFYGFAELTAAEARRVRGDDGWQMDVRGTPTLRNPLHADLSIWDDKGKDYDLMIAGQLCEFAHFSGFSDKLIVIGIYFASVWITWREGDGGAQAWVRTVISPDLI